MLGQYAVSILIKHSLGLRCWLGRCTKLLGILDLITLNQLCRYKQQSCADVFVANLQKYCGIISCEMLTQWSSKNEYESSVTNACVSHITESSSSLGDRRRIELRISSASDLRSISPRLCNPAENSGFRLRPVTMQVKPISARVPTCLPVNTVSASLTALNCSHISGRAVSLLAAAGCSSCCACCEAEVVVENNPANLPGIFGAVSAPIQAR